MDFIFAEHRDEGANGHAPHPVSEDLLKLDAEVIPEVDGLAL
jgi:hypothetical protein